MLETEKSFFAFKSCIQSFMGGIMEEMNQSQEVYSGVLVVPKIFCKKKSQAIFCTTRFTKSDMG